jgi:hypothetical protein
MKLLLKRDTTSGGFPSADQVDVGELVINSTTGKLYSKLQDGSIIEWVGQKICFEPTPMVKIYYDNNEITNDNIEDFCCLGAILEFEIDMLKLAPYKYSFELIELTSNTTAQNISVQTPIYTTYTVEAPVVDPDSPTVPEPSPLEGQTIRKALVPINVAIPGDDQPISIFKFVVNDDNIIRKKIVEKIITIKCKA